MANIIFINMELYNKLSTKDFFEQRVETPVDV